jgi:hypothetical protein
MKPLGVQFASPMPPPLRATRRLNCVAEIPAAAWDRQSPATSLTAPSSMHPMKGRDRERISGPKAASSAFEISTPCAYRPYVLLRRETSRNSDFPLRLRYRSPRDDGDHDWSIGGRASNN